MEDIKRTFMYHGSEHKCINCIEHGLELNVANVRASSKEHKRCGTSFIMIVMVISILFFMVIRTDTIWLRIVSRIVLVPVIAGVSYEFLSFAGKHDSKLVEIQAAGGNGQAVQCNVSDFESCKEMLDAVVKEHGHLDILVNNAGITRDNLLMKMSEEDFDAVIQTNLKGVFNCTRHIARQMLKQKSGRIINISSVSGVLGNAGQANYCAAKAGVIGLTKSAAKELASRGITVNAVAPGFIKTEMTEVLKDEIKNSILEHIPMKAFGETEDIANAVAFLASEEARYITGQVISVDGGMAM